jgi:glycosyltransferase involved in cell wall biosynthesis
MDPATLPKRLSIVQRHEIVHRLTDPDRRPRLRVGVHVGQLLQDIPGGIGRVTEMLCGELPRYADVVAFSTCPRRARRDLDERLGAAVEFRSLGWGAPRWRYEVWNRYRRHRIDLRVDVCHAPSLAVPPTAAPLVVTVNDVAFLRHPEAFTPHGLRFHEMGLAIARREAAVIIAPSAFTRDELVREGFDAERIYCVPLALRAPGALPSARTRAEIDERGVNAPYLLVAGTVEPRKGHATVVEAFERVRLRHPDLSLVIAGSPGWMARKAAADLERPGVVLLGSVSDAALDQLYREAEMVVNASIYEGFGLTVLEALARGRPVVASAIPAHIELVDGAARLFPPGDAGALADEIDDLLNDGRARDRLRHAALERAARFDLATTVNGHLDAYERAALDPRARPH